jgi:hypothetical protein
MRAASSDPAVRGRAPGNKNNLVFVTHHTNIPLIFL